MKRIHGLLRWRAQDRRLLLMHPPVIYDESLCDVLDVAKLMRPGAIVESSRARMQFVHHPIRPEVRMT